MSPQSIIVPEKPENRPSHINTIHTETISV